MLLVANGCVDLDVEFRLNIADHSRLIYTQTVMRLIHMRFDRAVFVFFSVGWCVRVDFAELGWPT